VRAFGPAIVVLETSTPTIDIDLAMARRLSRFSEIALAGPHASVFADDLARLPYVTYVLRGEYELSAVEMWRSRRPGVYAHRPREDVDDAPYPLRDPAVIGGYWDPSMPTARPQLQVYASRGCPYRCTYCMWPPVMYANTFRPRAPARVADEIRHCVAEYGSRSILFDDDTFNIGTDRISALCDELGRIGLAWTMMGRLDTSPPWLFDKMVDSGCVGMRFWVETFSGKLQANIKKRLDPDRAISMLRHLKERHPRLPIHITTMRDLPGETPEDRAHDVRVIRELGFESLGGLHNHQLSSCVPFPGTELHAQLVDLGFGEQLRDIHAFDGSPGSATELSKAITGLRGAA
jgi:radical SAM superfamily enzyme YgiQ (UPF0313 family)